MVYSTQSRTFNVWVATASGQYDSHDSRPTETVYHLRLLGRARVPRSARVPEVWTGGRMSDDLDARVLDLEGRVEAFNNARQYLTEQVEELEAENERLRERIAELEELVDPDPGSVSYDQLTKEQKIHRVRKKLAQKANGSRGGKARMTYKDVMWLFDGHPSTGHCYDLMECAARLDGYAYDAAGDGGEKRVRVNLDGVNDETLVHAVKEGTTETPA